MRKIIFSAMLLATVGIMGAYLHLTTATLGEEREGPRPVVVELFTSQGCSSCPAAERLLAELADRRDVLALAFHVDYWDGKGWKDPFSSPANTERQRLYTLALRQFGLATPQFVIEGETDVAGARKLTLLESIRTAAENMPVVPIKLIAAQHNRMTLRVGQDGDHAPCDIWLATFDHSHTNKVEGGENRGRFLVNRNTVRELFHLGEWKGGEKILEIPLDKIREADALAVLVQERNMGPMVGSFRHDFRETAPSSK